LCRRCSREMGDGRTQREIDAQRARQTPARAILTTTREPLYRVIRGVTYEVTFDGTRG
jgi:hypothetical protein